MKMFSMNTFNQFDMLVGIIIITGKLKVNVACRYVHYSSTTKLPKLYQDVLVDFNFIIVQATVIVRAVEDHE